MCLIALSYAQHPAYHLVVAANRDEFYDRPTAPATFWEDGDGILAGRDLRKGGTWFGVTRTGRWAAVTNYRDLTTPQKVNAPSRGELVTSFLRSAAPPEAFLDDLSDRAHHYNGFNLLVGTPTSLYYLSNRTEEVKALLPGLYGLSNHLLDTSWPKVERARTGMARTLEDEAVSAEGLLDLLRDATEAPEEELPATGLDPERERALSPIFIETPQYGTRSSTVLLIGRDGEVTFVERTYGEETTTRRFSFALETTALD